MPNPLPVDAVLPEIIDALKVNDELVLVAPPGAGKSTRVPLTLLDQHPGQGKILLLEPRRIAARALAQYMAASLGEPLGARVGLRVRQETQVSRSTRLEVVTGGVLLRLMQDDPALSDYGLIMFDEFHERSLDSDLGLALALQGRSLFRDRTEPLKLMVMSATLQDQTIAKYLDGAPVIRSEGRAWPVTVNYRSAGSSPELVDQCEFALGHALRDHEGNILVFLPGQREIERLFQRLHTTVPPDITVCRLYGALDLATQQQALSPLETDGPYRRKIILATDIAETSLTVDGVTVVIDSGYRREPVFDVRTGMSRLATIRVSRASAEQRAGRAGRTAPGHCYRLWSRELGLKAFDSAEIEQADLAPAVLQLLAWGINHPDELRWLTPPPPAAWQQAVDLLHDLSAVTLDTDRPRLTPHGAAMARFPAHPRLAHMMTRGSERGLQKMACRLAAILSEPGRPQDSIDIERMINDSGGSTHRHWRERVNRLAASFEAVCGQEGATVPLPSALRVGYLVACAYPDRIARRRLRSDSVYLLSNGRAARLEAQTDLTRHEWLAVAELGGNTGQSEDRIFAAAAFDLDLLQAELAHLLRREQIADWDDQRKRFSAETVWHCGAIQVRAQRIENPARELRIDALCGFLRRNELRALNWTADAQQWRARADFLRRHQISQPPLPPWPDLTDHALMNHLENWLAPHLGNVKNLADLQKLDLQPLLLGLLPWPLAQYLDEWAPTKIALPSGNAASVDYLQDPPVLAVKLQEMFGCQTTPTVARGKVKLLLHLLSPAGRPLQITQDLAHFWANSYDTVKKEMKGRYPKHPWPDDPLTATPTRLTKRKLNL